MKELNKEEKRKYGFSEYNPSWVNQFNLLKNFLQEVFGNKAIEIEHIGSTAVEGMKAKPVIDVLVTVETIKDLEEQKEKMIEAGYEWAENYIAPQTLIFFRVGEEGEKTDNIHVCEKDSPKARQLIIIRDYLRVHPKKAEEYSNLKEKNKELYPDDYPAYREAKSSFLKQIEKEAYKWFDDIRLQDGEL
jgi:GrpB-like predicted nucleotidyltransferase (UPF0157 family)